MAEILLLHHALGLTDGVLGFAETLREAGHTVHTPDLFEGRRFAAVEEGVAFEEEVGWEAMVARTSAAAEALPPELVYAGMSLGAVYATRLLLTRPGAEALLSLYAAVPPDGFERPWPAGAAAQVHQATDDPWRDPEADDRFAAEVPGAEMYLYAGERHLFGDSGSPDFDPTAAALMTERVLAFLD